MSWHRNGIEYNIDMKITVCEIVQSNKWIESPDSQADYCSLNNKPDQATMRPDCVSTCIDFGARLGQTET